MSHAIRSVERLFSTLNIQNVEDIHNLYLIALAFGIKVIEDKLTTCDAYIVYEEKKPHIMVDKFSNPYRKRFSVAHELGHYFMHNLNVPLFCTKEMMESWDRSHLPDRELEANEFAANLIMPEMFFKKDADFDPDFSKIIQLGDKYRTSIMATTRRFIEYYPVPSAMVVSVGGIIKWFVPNRYFDEEKLFVDVRGNLSPGTQAYNIHHGYAPTNKPRPVDQELWLKNSTESYDKLYEISLYQKFYDSIISIIWFED